MTNQKSPGMKPKKPLYYIKSKAAKEDEDYKELYENEDLPPQKQSKYNPSRIKKVTRYNREYEYTDYDDEYGGDTEDLPNQKPYKHSPSRTKKNFKYNREYEYTDYDDEYGGNQYKYDHEREVYDSDDEFSAYTTEYPSNYRRRPGRLREYYSMADTEYFDDSDSDCLTCNSRRGQRSDFTFQNPSQYQHEDIPASRHRNVQRQSIRRRKVVPSQIEIKRSPHQQKTKNRSNGFSNRRYYPQEYEEGFDNRNTPYRSYFDTNDRENHYQRNPHEVYVAREPIGHKVFKLKNQQVHTSESGSEMNVDDEEEEQEEGIEELGWRKNQSRYQVFAANTEDNRGVFQQQPRQNPRETLLSVTEYDSTVPMVALASTRANKSPDKSQSIVYLPVVVKDNTIKLRHSKVVHAESILKTIGERAEKPLERDMNVYLQTENGQANIFQQSQKRVEQEITTSQNIEVYTAQPTHSLPLDKKPSVISKLASKIGLNTRSKDKSDYPVQKSYINVVPSRTKPVEPKGSKISLKSGLSKTSVGSTRIGTHKPKTKTGSASTQKPETKDKKGKKNQKPIKPSGSDSEIVSVINPSPSIESNKVGKNMITPTKSYVQKPKLIHGSASQMTNLNQKSVFDEHKSLLKQSNLNRSELSKSSKKNTLKTQRSLEQQCSKEDVKINVDQYSSPNASKSKENIHNGKKSPSGKKIQTKRSNVELSKKTEEFQFWKVLSFDSHAFKYIYQAMQYFLGLSIHGTLMEVLRNAKHSD